MQALFQISLALLLLGAQSVHPTPLFKKGLPEENQQNILDSLNNFRAGFAKAARISNMNELTYNPDLEKLAESYTSSCDSTKEATQLNHYFPVDKKIENDFIKYTAAHKEDIDGLESLFGVETYFYSVLRSLHSEVGCSRLAEPCADKPMITVLCLFGPKVPPTTLERAYGAPGSHCYAEKHENGLCKKYWTQ